MRLGRKSGPVRASRGDGRFDDKPSGSRKRSMPDYSFIRYSIAGAVGWVEFNRPPVNAFHRPMVDETHDCIAAALDDPAVRVLVLASAVEGYFSAGADLNAFKGLTAAGIRDWTTRCHQIVRL